MDIRYIQKYEYIPENVRKGNLNCGNYQGQMNKRYTNFQRRSMKLEQGQTILNRYIHLQSGWRFSSMKSCENEFKIVFQYKYHHWIFRNVFLIFDKYRGIWITVHHCAKRKKTSIICVANLHSLPWNTTSKAHKIRTVLKRRWIFKRASGKPLPPRCG